MVSLTDAEYADLTDRVARVAAATLPADRFVLVVARGDEGLLARLGSQAWHFPCAADGTWTGHYPEDDTAAIAHVEALRVLGAEFLLLPSTSTWWLEHYRVLAGHLDSRYQRLAADQDDCVLFDLRVAARAPWTEDLDAVAHAVWMARGRPPTLLDWDTGLDPAGHVAGLPAVSRPRGGRLPDLDGTVDIVVLRDGDAAAAREAQRSAAAVIVDVRGGASSAVRWTRRIKRPAASIALVALCANGSPHAGRRLRSLREIFPGEIVAAVEPGTPDAEQVHAVAHRDPRQHVLELESHMDLARAAAAVPAVAEADVVALLSADALLLPGWWRAALRAVLLRADAGAVGGWVVGDPDRPRVTGAVICGPGGVLVLRTETLLQASTGDGLPARPGNPLGEIAERVRRLGRSTYVDPALAAAPLTAPLATRGGAPTPPRAGVTGSDRRRRALVVTPRLSSEDAAIGRRRLLDHAAALTRGGWLVALACLEGQPPRQIAQELSDLGIAIGELPGEQLAEHVAAGGFELVLLADWRAAEHVLRIREAAPGARITIDCPSLDLLRDARRNFTARTQPIVTPLGVEYGAALAGELAVYAAADAVLASCEIDAALVGQLSADPLLAHVVPATATPARGKSFAARRGLVFAGCAENPADIEALAWLVEEILPRLGSELLAQHPLFLLGAGLARCLPADAATSPDIRFVGAVPSLTPYLANARAMLCPLAATAGAHPAVAAAQAAGLPVVATGLIAESLELRPGVDLLTAEDTDGLALAIRVLVDDERRWQLVVAAARRRSRRLRPEIARDRLLGAIGSTLTREPKGQLLTEEDLERVEWRRSYVENQCAIVPIRAALERLTPTDATVLVVSDGGTELLRLHPRRAMPFPQHGDGTHHMFTPQDPTELFALLERLRARGADHLVIPRAQRWWLSYFPELDRHLRTEHQVLVDEDSCVLVRLRRPRRRRRRRARDDAADAPLARLIALYLPQFHPIPENDAWWGAGFTEWTNVGRADPLFAGHEQPHLPGELGFYDLRLAETRRAQADLAREHGIHGFCYYHYWFEGRRLLEHPFEQVLASREPDFPFCLCWANEPWSRRWDGGSGELLQAQTYSEQDDQLHIASLLPALADRRAITVDGRPLLLVYRARSLPEPARTARTWRLAARRAGLPGLHLVAVETARDAGWDATRLGFDAKLHFAPQFDLLRPLEQLNPDGCSEGPRVYDYQQVWPALADPAPVDYRRYEAVCPRWDNTPRARRAGVVLHNSSPAAYESWLTQAIRRAAAGASRDHRLVFINAWNEWGEGCHLEPDVAHGRGYLEATRRALVAAGDRSPGVPGRPRHQLPAR